MKKYTKDELAKILVDHKAWLKDASEGVRANLRSANLRSANLHGAKGLDPFRWQITPQTGAFEAYKKLVSGVVRISIPADALRVNAPGSRRVRVSKLTVAELVSGTADKLVSQYNRDFVYAIGGTFEPDSFDPDPTVECSHGLHVFLTREEATEFDL